MNSIMDRTISLRKIGFYEIEKVFLLLFVASVFVFAGSPDTVRISNIAFLIFAFVVLLCVGINNWVVAYDDINFGVYLPFAAYSVLSVLIAINRSLAFQKLETVLLLVAMAVLINLCIKPEIKNINFLLVCIMIGGLGVALMVLTEYGVSGIIDGILHGNRIGKDILQLNYLGRSTYYTSAIAFYLAYYKRHKWLYLVFALTTLVTLASGSRQSQLALLIVLVLLFTMKGISVNWTNAVIKILLLLVCLIIVWNLPWLDAVRERMYSGLIVMYTRENATDGDSDRFQMIVFGLETFVKNPVWGIGLGNIREVVGGTVLSDRGYLHNNYAELLACGGLLGFCSYYYIYLKLFVKTRRIVKVSGWSDELIICFALLIAQLELEFFGVYYYSKVQYLLFALAFLVVRCISQKTVVQEVKEGECLK